MYNTFGILVKYHTTVKDNIIKVHEILINKDK